MNPPSFDVITVTLNPAVDRTITVANLTCGTVNRVGEEHSKPGGKGINVASALTNYGHAVAVTGFLGSENSASFEALFQEKKIANHFVRIPGSTRTGIKIVDPVQHQTTDINFPGLAPAPSDLAELRSRLSSLTAGWVALCGSVPPGVDKTIYRDLIRDLKSRGRKVLLDTSGEPLNHALDAAPNIIKPNIDELRVLLGEPLNTEIAIIEAARKLIAHGVETVVVSMSKDGALFITAREVVMARPPDVEVKSTVGAGDAMVAGILSAELGGLPLKACAKLATAFSALALSDGGNESNCRSQIAKWMEHVITSPL